MGTNYFVCTDEPCEHCRGTGKRFQHLGKSSAGWPFLLNPFLSTFSAIRAFISGRLIVDEYGDKESAEDFIDMVDRKKGYSTHWDTSEDSSQYESIDKDGYRFSRYDEFG